MNRRFNYETYLYVSAKKLIILVNDDLNENIYKDELIFEEATHEIVFEKLNYILNKNIFQIEKKLNSFIEKIFVIIDLDIFFSLEISVKKNNYNDIIQLSNINHLLYEARDCCKKTIEQKKIIHMIIKNYQIDNKNYSFLPNNINCNNFSLDVNFLCISNKFIEKLEKILKNFQITISQIVDARYINQFVSDGEENLFLMTKKIITGHNPNEVKLVEKTTENKGFFEKFFNFFN